MLLFHSFSMCALCHGWSQAILLVKKAICHIQSVYNKRCMIMVRNFKLYSILFTHEVVTTRVTVYKIPRVALLTVRNISAQQDSDIGKLSLVMIY